MSDVNIDEALADYERAIDPLEKVTAGKIISLYYILTEDFVSSLKYSLEVLPYTKEISDKELVYKIHHYVAASYHNHGEFQKAKEYYHLVYDIALELNDSEKLIYTNLNLASIELFLGNYEVSLEYFFRAELESEVSENDDLLASTCYQIGIVYTNLKIHDLALEKFKKARRYDKSKLFAGEIFMNMAELYKDKKDYTLATGYIKRALKHFEKDKKDYEYKDCLLRLAEIYTARKTHDLALVYAKRAWDGFDTEQTLVLYSRACSLLGKLYTDFAQFDEAKKYFDMFVAIEDQIEAEREKQLFYERYHHYLSTIKDFEQAYEYQSKFVYSQTQIYAEEMMRNISIATAKFEYEQTRKEADRFREKNVIIEQQKSELQKLHDERVSLMNTISHDLKNYIGAAQQALEVACHKSSEIKENKFVQLSINSNTRALDLVVDILYSTKIHSATNDIEMINCNIHNLIIESEEALKMKAGKKDITIVYDLNPDHLMLDIDVDKWFRIFENLTTNAIKFTCNGGQITIKTRKTDKKATISFIDTGIGISPENIPKLFTEFSGVGRKGTAGEASTGLGLSIVKTLIEMLHGQIEVFSEVGVGTEFRITFDIH
jgi:signal transduction histidine kinase